jgi:hypothetical protein
MTALFVATLLRAGTIIEELPLTDVAYTRRLGGSSAGDLTAKLALVDRFGSYARAQALLDATDPWRCAVWALSDGELRWGGPIVSRPYQSGVGSVDIKAAEISAFFARRSVPVDRTHTGVDQLAIQRTLYSDAMATPGSDVGVQLGSDASGVLRDRTYTAASRKNVETASAELSNVVGGFDYAWEPVKVGGTYRIALRQGVALASSQVVGFEYPGDVLAYTFPDEGAALATMSWAIGEKDAGTGLTPQASATATALLDSGYPLLERVESYSDVSDTTTLQAHADADLTAQAGNVTQIDLHMSLEALVTSGLVLGNTVRFRADDSARFPLGLDIDVRCVAITERPLDGTATVTCADRLLTGGRLPARGDTGSLLAGLARRVLQLEAG